MGNLNLFNLLSGFLNANFANNQNNQNNNNSNSSAMNSNNNLNVNQSVTSGQLGYPESFYTSGYVKSQNVSQIDEKNDNFAQNNEKNQDFQSNFENRSQTGGIFNNDLIKNLLPLILGKNAGNLADLLKNGNSGETNLNLSNLLGGGNFNLSNIMSLFTKNKKKEHKNNEKEIDDENVIDLSDYTEVV